MRHLILVLALGAAGCQVIPPPSGAPQSLATAEPPAPDVPAPPVAPPPAISVDACGADSLSKWLNSVLTPELRGQIATRVGERTIRVYSQGEAVTEDYSPERLNVELGKDRRVTRFWCG